MEDVFKYILSSYLDDEDKRNILSGNKLTDFDIADMLNISLSYDNEYALIFSSKNGNLNIVKFLVSKGADIHNFNEILLLD